MPADTAPATPFKDNVGATSIAQLADSITAVDATFDRARFTRAARRGLAALELKARVDHVASALPRGFGTRTFPDAAATLTAAFDGAELSMWAAWPALTFVEQQGLDHPDEALDALGHLTRQMSAEFAVRPFVEAHPERTMREVHRWARHRDVHRRRLASEGIRPRLPWGRRLPAFVADPSPVIAVIDGLHADPEEYVRRSVANNLNDIAKDHPELTVATARRWLAETEHPERTAATVQHGLRSLVKVGDPAALDVLGFAHDVDIEVADLLLEPTAIDLGESIGLGVTLRNPGSTSVRLVVDYLLHRVLADGSTAPKVFKLATVELAGGESVALRRNIRIKPVTIRRYHPGVHAIEIQVNGTARARADFVLRTGG